MKLTYDDAEAIREASRHGVMGTDLARFYKVHKLTVYSIIHRKSYLSPAVVEPVRSAGQRVPKPPEPTGRIIWCGNCNAMVQQPCIKCWSDEHAQPGDGERSRLQQEGSLDLDLSDEMEGRLAEAREMADTRMRDDPD